MAELGRGGGAGSVPGVWQAGEHSGRGAPTLPCCLPPRAVLQSGVYVAGTELEGLHREVRRLLGPTLCAQHGQRGRASLLHPWEEHADTGG